MAAIVVETQALTNALCHGRALTIVPATMCDGSSAYMPLPPAFTAMLSTYDLSRSTFWPPSQTPTLLTRASIHIAIKLLLTNMHLLGLLSFALFERISIFIEIPPKIPLGFPSDSPHLWGKKRVWLAYFVWRGVMENVGVVLEAGNRGTLYCVCVLHVTSPVFCPGKVGVVFGGWREGGAGNQGWQQLSGAGVSDSRRIYGGFCH